jgi:hypothetical protein
MAQLVETGQVTLDDLRELEATIESSASPKQPVYSEQASEKLRRHRRTK